MPGRAGGAGGKDKTGTMLVVAGAILVILVAFFGFISTKGMNKKKDAQDSAGKPNLGRVVTPSAPGQLVPADKMAVESATARTSPLEANDIEKTKSLKAGTFGVPATSSSPAKAPVTGTKTLGQVPPFQQPDTSPDRLKTWSPEPYPGGGGPHNGKRLRLLRKSRSNTPSRR